MYLRLGSLLVITHIEHARCCFVFLFLLLIWLSLLGTVSPVVFGSCEPALEFSPRVVCSRPALVIKLVFAYGTCNVQVGQYFNCMPLKSDFSKGTIPEAWLYQ